MNEMIHIFEHAIGLCGERHVTLLGSLNEIAQSVPYLNYMFHDIKRRVGIEENSERVAYPQDTDVLHLGVEGKY